MKSVQFFFCFFVFLVPCEPSALIRPAPELLPHSSVPVRAWGVGEVILPVARSPSLHVNQIDDGLRLGPLTGLGRGGGRVHLALCFEDPFTSKQLLAGRHPPANCVHRTLKQTNRLIYGPTSLLLSTRRWPKSCYRWRCSFSPTVSQIPPPSKKNLFFLLWL